jgi:hypothetical protein
MKWGIQNMFHGSLVENTNLDKWLYVAIGRKAFRFENFTSHHKRQPY